MSKHGACDRYDCPSEVVVNGYLRLLELMECDSMSGAMRLKGMGMLQEGCKYLMLTG